MALVSIWPLLGRLGCVAAGALLAVSVQAQTSRVLINPGDQSDQPRIGVYNQWKSALEPALRKAGWPDPGFVFSSDATRDLQTTRSRLHEVYLAPAHVIGSALRYGYTPVMGSERSVQAVLVAPTASGLSSLSGAQGKRLGLPSQDSVVTYLIRGELNALNTTVKRHFGPVFQTRYQDALLPCLQLRRCDVVAVEKAVYERWVAAGEKLTVLMESRAVPGLSVAVRDDGKLNPQMLKAAIAGSLPEPSVDLVPGDFDYVATLGYFTPRSLPGAQVVNAAAVAALLQRGARYIDTRTQEEFKAGRVPGAVWVPYEEKSQKDADYDGAVDRFDLTQLGSDRSRDLIFACNGAECWKSYKASHAALKAGFSKVHWFRGGLPEWRGDGLAVVSGD